VEVVRDLIAPTSASELFQHVSDLDRYPAWMPLIHGVEQVSDDSAHRPMWIVELRAQVGPFARSKRLRMCRTVVVDDELVVFERTEDDGRSHAPWILRVTVSELGPVDGEPQSRVEMKLTYGGSLWAGPVLERVLDDQVKRGSQNLLALVV
jgi:hypothetical protein